MASFREQYGASSGFSFSNLEEDSPEGPHRRNHQVEEPNEENIPGQFPASLPGERSDDSEIPDTDATEPNTAHSKPYTRRHYLPRTCRICFDVVLPTYETSEEGIASTFNPAPKVSYISEDPADGRLISPCMSCLLFPLTPKMVLCYSL